MSGTDRLASAPARSFEARAIATPLLDETITVDRRRYRVAWFDPPFLPPLPETSQALGICFTGERQIVLVTWNDRQWSLPGGTIEPGETLEHTLTRELWEEACARVLACRYIGCQRVDELDEEHKSYYQTRFWARVALEPFTGEHEMTARRLVPPADFLSTLFWGGEATARLILERGLAIESELAAPHRRPLSAMRSDRSGTDESPRTAPNQPSR